MTEYTSRCLQRPVLIDNPKVGRIFQSTKYNFIFLFQIFVIPLYPKSRQMELNKEQRNEISAWERYIH